MGDLPPRTQIENLWRTRVEAARQRYKEAAANHRKTQDEWQQSFTPRPDGQYAAKQAREHESATLHEYARVLKIFRDLVVRGKMPPSE